MSQTLENDEFNHFLEEMNEWQLWENNHGFLTVSPGIGLILDLFEAGKAIQSIG